MKKIARNAFVLIASVVSSVSLAESDFYGSIRQTLLYTDTDGANTDGDIGVVDSESRFGFQGRQEIGSVTAFGRWELGLEANDQLSSPVTRLGFVGLSGDFGAVSFGSQWSAWDSYIGGDHTNFAEEGEWHNGTERNGDTLKYVGQFAGVTVEADAVLVAQETGEEATEQPVPVTGANSGVLDEVQVALSYEIGSVSLEGAVIGRDGGEDGYMGGGFLYGARVGYNTGGPLTLAFAVALDDEDFGGDDERTLGFKLRASYKIGANNFLAIVTQANRNNAATRPFGIAVGYQYNLSKRSRVSLEMSSVDPDIAGSDVMTEGGVMYRHDW